MFSDSSRWISVKFISKKHNQILIFLLFFFKQFSIDQSDISIDSKHEMVEIPCAWRWICFPLGCDITVHGFECHWTKSEVSPSWIERREFQWFCSNDMSSKSLKSKTNPLFSLFFPLVGNRCRFCKSYLCYAINTYWWRWFYALYSLRSIDRAEFQIESLYFCFWFVSMRCVSTNSWWNKAKTMVLLMLGRKCLSEIDWK